MIGVRKDENERYTKYVSDSLEKVFKDMIHDNQHFELMEISSDAPLVEIANNLLKEEKIKILKK